MFKMNVLISSIVLVGISVFAQAPTFKRTLLQQVDISVPGREAVTAKAELPKGVAAGRHTHPGEEIGYVLEGTVSLEIEGVSKTLKAGDAFLIPSGKVHDAKNLGDGQATIIATYIVDKGKPLATPAK
jgi:quercetin dioxygenase-like cupin family protein